MSNYAIPPDSIYDKSLMLDNGYVLSVSIQPLSYSFISSPRISIAVFLSLCQAHHG